MIELDVISWGSMIEPAEELRMTAAPAITTAVQARDEAGGAARERGDPSAPEVSEASRTAPGRRRSAGAAVATVITALAIAIPVAEAGAATRHEASPPTIASGRAADPTPRSLVERSDGRETVVTGPSIIGSVFNGSTTIITSPSPVVATTNGRQRERV
jgi:hypothetical protein